MSGFTQDFKTVVIGGGQSGLAVGYYLRQYDHDYLIVDASERIGDAWRNRWDSLRLFTQAKHSSLPGLPFPTLDEHFPTKDEVADYLEDYAATFDLPVRLKTTVERLTRRNERYLIETSTRQFTAENVVVATGSFSSPSVPAFADELASSITRFHSSSYQNPEQVPAKPTLVVGAGNAGAEIATDLASAERRTYLSGPKTGSIPLSVFNSRAFWWLGQNVLTAGTWLCERIKQRSRTHGDPLVRLSERDIRQAGVERVPRTRGVEDGQPIVDSERLDVASVVWATGFQPAYEQWIDISRLRFDESGYPIHNHGVVEECSALYFIGLPYQSTVVSASLGGVGPDARRLIGALTSE